MALSTFAGGRLWGARYGTATPWVLALHGWRRDHHDWDEVLEGLDAVALDLPGHGVAPEPPEPWSTRQYADWVAPVLRDLAGGPVVVAGHSFGARVAVQLAAPWREDGEDGTDAASITAASMGAASMGAASMGAASMGAASMGAASMGAASMGAASMGAANIAALVLVAAPLAPAPGAGAPRSSLVYRAGRMLNRVGFVPDHRMEQLRRKHGSDDYRQASPVMRGVLVRAVNETARAAYMPPLRTWAAAGRPVDLVWGERDAQASFAGVSSRLGDIESATATVVPGAGHLMMGDLAKEVRAALLRHQPPR
jgi:pimeloyl-ACP methyl ester carboxylesterase